MKQNTGFERTKKILIGLADIFLFHISVILSFLLRYKGEIPHYNYMSYENAMVYIFGIFIFLNILFGVYILYNKSRIDFLYLTVIIQLLMTFIIMATTFLGRWFTFPRSVIAIIFIISTIVLFLWRMIVFRLYEKIDGTKKVMVVGSKEACRKAIYNFEHSKNKRHIITMANINNFYENVSKNMEKVDIVYIADQINNDEKRKIYETIVRNDKKLFLNTNFENLVLVNPNIMSIEDESIIEASNFRISPENDVIKRTIDFIISLLLLILTSPLLILSGVLIKITSKGPIFYKQTRITKDQKEFNILKFRTMSATAEKDSGPVLASANDNRITLVGKYFRALRIDELPQLINVLKGEMALVGPRPERPFFVNQFKEMNPSYYLRHNIRAGITGYAQVYGKYATDFNSKLNFDLLYIKNYSLLMDVKIMLQTIKILFDKVSSQGLEEVVIGDISANITILE